MGTSSHTFIQQNITELQACDKLGDTVVSQPEVHGAFLLENIQNISEPVGKAR